MVEVKGCWLDYYMYIYMNPRTISWLREQVVYKTFHKGAAAAAGRMLDKLRPSRWRTQRSVISVRHAHASEQPT